jgi:chemotaxis protein methyltransferase CheR
VISIDKTLKELSQVMAAHKRALAMDGSAMPAPQIEPVPPLAPPIAPDDPRAVAVHGLMHDVQRIAGIQVSDALEQKVVRLFAGITIEELEAWIRNLRLVPDDHPQWQALIESLTVHETYFHRDRLQLDYLAAQVLPQLIEVARASGRKRLRIWSAGCATGEEPYSLAILTLDALIAAGCADELLNSGIHLRPGWSVQVLGTDISHAALKHARRAEYTTGSLSSFRDLPTRLLRFFLPIEYARNAAGEGLEPSLRRVRDDVRQIVRFEPFNLVSLTPPAENFDIVACRNVLIYLAPEPARQAQRTLHRALRPGGYLLLGPTDTLALQQRYETFGGPSTLIHRRKLEVS